MLADSKSLSIVGVERIYLGRYFIVVSFMTAYWFSIDAFTKLVGSGLKLRTCGSVVSVGFEILKKKIARNSVFACRFFEKIIM